MSTDSKGASGPADEGDGQSGITTCYRHRDRETYVRCNRCDRPICPDCMREATVGFHCPDCVRTGNRAMREGRTVFGGKVRGSTALVVWTLVAINVGVFLAEFVSPGYGLVNRFGMQPLAVADGQWWRLITSAFLHAPNSFFHVLVNMFALYVLGPHLEALLGRTRFLTLYLLSALGGSTLSYLVAAPGAFSIGASGAIFGLFGAIFVVAKRLSLDTRWILGLLAINLAITFLVPIISWQAHLGGLATGTAVAAAYAYAPRSARTPVQLGASVGVLVVLALLLLARTPMLAG